MTRPSEPLVSRNFAIFLIALASLVMAMTSGKPSPDVFLSHLSELTDRLNVPDNRKPFGGGIARSVIPIALPQRIHYRTERW